MIDYKRRMTLVLWTLYGEDGKIITNGAANNMRLAKKAAQHALRMQDQKK